jgi:hypothetical protein
MTTIDIAHPPMRSEDAELLLDQSLRQVSPGSTVRALKIVHGYGSKSASSVLKSVVADWTHKRRSALRAVISGHEYSIYNSTTQSMRKECGQIADPDLESANPGITILWIK